MWYVFISKFLFYEQASAYIFNRVGNLLQANRGYSRGSDFVRMRRHRVLEKPVIEESAETTKLRSEYQIQREDMRRIPCLMSLHFHSGTILDPSNKDIAALFFAFRGSK